MRRHQHCWYVKRKGESRAGPFTHRGARARALKADRADDRVSQLVREWVDPETGKKHKKTLTPRFPELERRAKLKE